MCNFMACAKAITDHVSEKASVVRIYTAKQYALLDRTLCSNIQEVVQRVVLI